MYDLRVIDKMNGGQFERFLYRFFTAMGYEVIITPLSNDQGLDLVLLRNNKVIGVSAKRYNTRNPVGNGAVQEIISGQIYYDCDEGWIITTSYFTESAKKLAIKASVKLIDRDELISILTGQILGFNIAEGIENIIPLKNTQKEKVDLVIKNEIEVKLFDQNKDEIVNKAKYYISYKGDARVRALRDYIGANSSTMPLIYEQLVNDGWLLPPRSKRTGYEIIATQAERNAFLQLYK